MLHLVFYSFAIHYVIVYDVTKTDCWAQNGGTHGRGFATFTCRFVENVTRKRANNCSLYSFYSSPLERPVSLPIDTELSVVLGVSKKVV